MRNYRGFVWNFDPDPMEAEKRFEDLKAKITAGDVATMNKVAVAAMISLISIFPTPTPTPTPAPTSTPDERQCGSWEKEMRLLSSVRNIRDVYISVTCVR